MAMQIIQKLINAIVEKGGDPELLYCFCSEHPLAGTTINAIAQSIIDAKWPIPRSLVERLAEEKSRFLHDPGAAAKDRKWYWNIIDLEEKFGIPVLMFSNDNPEFPAIPTEIQKQLVGKRVTYPLYVQWEGAEHVVVDQALGIEEGEVLTDKYFKDGNIGISPADRFDMKH